MANRDPYHSMKSVRTVSPVAVGTTGTGQTGKIVDTKGYLGVALEVSYGSVTATNAVFTVVVKEGDVTGTMTSVADANLIGTESSVGLAAATRTSGTTKNVTKRLAYIGGKRYVSANISSTVTAGPPVGVNVILTNPMDSASTT